MAVARALVNWSDQHSLGSKSTPRYLYDCTGRVTVGVVDPSAFSLSSTRMWSLKDLGKFISTVLESLKGVVSIGPLETSSWSLHHVFEF